jgi:probable phosphoglycerate mutase
VTARRLVIWRHGRTEWNLGGRFQGQTDIELDSVGVSQAQSSAARLAALEPAALVASDLRRTAATAAELARLTGLEVTYDPDLREIDVGSWAGLTQAEFASAWPEEASLLAAGVDVRRGGGDGETVAEVADRASKALLRAAESAPDASTVVVATHGLAGRVGIAQLVGLPAEHWSVLGGLSNCAWSVIEAGRRGWRIVEWNAGTLPAPVLSDDR